MNPQWQRYRELELILDTPLKSNKARRSAQSPAHSAQKTPWWQRLWQVIDVVFFRDLEPQVWQTTDSETGQVCWHIYDPETGKTHHLQSDLEVRQWLEKLFHH